MQPRKKTLADLCIRMQCNYRDRLKGQGRWHVAHVRAHVESANIGIIQGDASRCSLASVDLKIRVVFLEGNLCFYVIRTYGTT